MPLSSLVPGTGTHAGTGTMSIRIWATARESLTPGLRMLVDRPFFIGPPQGMTLPKNERAIGKLDPRG